MFQNLINGLYQGTPQRETIDVVNKKSNPINNNLMFHHVKQMGVSAANSHRLCVILAADSYYSPMHHLNSCLQYLTTSIGEEIQYVNQLGYYITEIVLMYRTVDGVSPLDGLANTYATAFNGGIKTIIRTVNIITKTYKKANQVLIREAINSGNVMLVTFGRARDVNTQNETEKAKIPSIVTEANKYLFHNYYFYLHSKARNGITKWK